VLRDNIEFWQGGTWMNEPININSTRQHRNKLVHHQQNRFQSFLQTLGQTMGLLPVSRYERVAKLQDKWLSHNGYNNSTLHMDYCGTIVEEDSFMDTSCWQRKIDIVLQMFQQQQQWKRRYPWKRRGLLQPELPYPSTEPPLKYVSLPFLRTEAWSYHIPFDDAYYNLIREWFVMNMSDPECCPTTDQLPRPDEVVFHYRNFRREWNKYVYMGFDEINPVQAVHQLLLPIATATQENRIALLSRFPSDLHPFVEALNQSSRHFEVRVITNGTTASDFCFLQQTQYLLVGVHISSFVKWAGLLGKSDVLLYVMNSTNNILYAKSVNKTFEQCMGNLGWLNNLDRFHGVVVPEISFNDTRPWRLFTPRYSIP
jgi:hypothetical protein